MMRTHEIVDVLDRLARRPGSGVRRAPDSTADKPRYSIDFRAFDDPPPDVRCTVLGRPWRAGLVRAVPGCPRLVATSEYIGHGPAARLCWVVRLRTPVAPPPACAMQPLPRRSSLPLARMAAHIAKCGAIRVVAVAGDPDGTMTLTYGRIVLDPGDRPRYAWSAVREVRGLAGVYAAIAQDPEPCAALWWPDMREVRTADAGALLERMRDARAA